MNASLHPSNSKKAVNYYSVESGVKFNGTGRQRKDVPVTDIFSCIIHIFKCTHQVSRPMYGSEHYF